MSNISGIMEPEVAIGKSTLVGRVSNMLKDGNYSGPPMLFRHASMQKIRHCCQNLNLLPYLLYSFDNSKSHPIARKVHVCFSQLLKEITAKIFFLYKIIQHSGLRVITTDDGRSRTPRVNVAETAEPTEKPTSRVQMFERQKSKQQETQKPKRNPIFLILAVYLAPLILAFQVIGLFNLMVFGKYTPGFIFLIVALIVLGCISLKILFHESVVHRVKSEKKKVH